MVAFLAFTVVHPKFAKHNFWMSNVLGKKGVLWRSWVFCWKGFCLMLDFLKQSGALFWRSWLYWWRRKGVFCYCFVTIVILVFSQINFLILAIFLHVTFRNTCVVRIRALSLMVGGFCCSHFVQEERGVMVVNGCNSEKAWEERSKRRSIYFVTLCNQSHWKLKVIITA